MKKDMIIAERIISIGLDSSNNIEWEICVPEMELLTVYQKLDIIRSLEDIKRSVFKRIDIDRGET